MFPGAEGRSRYLAVQHGRGPDPDHIDIAPGDEFRPVLHGLSSRGEFSAQKLAAAFREALLTATISTLGQGSQGWEVPGLDDAAAADNADADPLGFRAHG